MKPAHLLSMLVAITASFLHPSASAEDLDAERRLFERVVALAPEGVDLQAVNINKQQVRIEGRCEQPARVAKLISLLDASAGLQASNLRSLVRGSDGQLTFVITSLTRGKEG